LLALERQFVRQRLAKTFGGRVSLHHHALGLLQALRQGFSCVSMLRSVAGPGAVRGSVKGAPVRISLHELGMVDGWGGRLIGGLSAAVGVAVVFSRSSRPASSALLGGLRDGKKSGAQKRSGCEPIGLLEDVPARLKVSPTNPRV
jgi:hypothetical protein